MTEHHYQFRRRLEMAHRPDRRDPEAVPAEGEAAVGDGWSIVVGGDASDLVLNVAKDLQDYLLTSMGVSVLLRRSDMASAAHGSQVIVLGTAAEMPELGSELSVARSYRLVCAAERIVVCGADAKGVGQGCYYLEDVMNLREAPFAPVGDVTRAPAFAPRMTHSGWGLDEFPDGYLNAMAHAGFDSVLVFVSGVDTVPSGYQDRVNYRPTTRYQDLNGLIDRAERHGLDVYFYAYFRDITAPHPDAPGAEAYYDSTYGAVFRACPRAKGIVLVGESIEFPSKDPNTSGRMRFAPVVAGTAPSSKPTSGWWPCVDWPQWLEMVSRVVRRHNPAADIVFWTYNWGYAPEEDRLALIRALPDDVSLLVTFEMFEEVEREGVLESCVDYTASFVGPGKYFASEAQVATERGLRLYAMSNTGGLTWDFGDIPYEPVPEQWSRRHAALHDAQARWGLSGLMESHHFGWWPSFVSEAAKWAYWTPSPSAGEARAAIARRDFGPDGAPAALRAWTVWSNAIGLYITTGEDQYGPFRVGPSYPFALGKAPSFPASEHAMFGAFIVNADYHPSTGGRRPKTAVPARTEFEVRSLTQMAELWQEGVDELAAAAQSTAAGKRGEAERMLGLGRFILCAIRTAIHIKQWWLLKQRLGVEDDPARANEVLDQLVTIGERELANARAAIPLVDADSRLGWEPSMEYVCDREHLEWKITQLEHVLSDQIPSHRRALDVTPTKGR